MTVLGHNDFPSSCSRMIIQGVPGDFELKITSVPVINPEVVRQLSRRFNADIDVAGLQELAHSTDGFHPDEALRRLSQEFRLVEGLEFARALRLGMFSSAPQELSARAVDRIHPLLDAVIDAWRALGFGRERATRHGQQRR